MIKKFSIFRIHLLSVLALFFCTAFGHEDRSSCGCDIQYKSVCQTESALEYHFQTRMLGGWDDAKDVLIVDMKKVSEMVSLKGVSGSISSVIQYSPDLERLEYSFTSKNVQLDPSVVQDAEMSVDLQVDCPWEKGSFLPARLLSTATAMGCPSLSQMFSGCRLQLVNLEEATQNSLAYLLGFNFNFPYAKDITGASFIICMELFLSAQKVELYIHVPMNVDLIKKFPIQNVSTERSNPVVYEWNREK